MIGYLGASGFIGRSFMDYSKLHSLEVRPFVRDPAKFTYSTANKFGAAYECSLGKSLVHSDFRSIDTLVLSVSATRPNTPGNTILNEIEVNVKPHVQFLNELKNTDVKRVIFLSSGGAVYGDIKDQVPVTEVEVCQPITAYGYGKHCIEGAISNIWKGDGRSYVILRPSNPVGKHQISSLGSHGLVTTVIDKIRKSEIIKVAGKGSAVRDYFRVEDLCSLICNIHTHTIDSSLILNASSGVGSTINQVIETVSAVMKKKAVFEYGAGPEPDIGYNVLNSSRAQRLFSWEPTVDLSAIIALLIDSSKTLD